MYASFYPKMALLCYDHGPYAPSDLFVEIMSYY